MGRGSRFYAAVFFVNGVRGNKRVVVVFLFDFPRRCSELLKRIRGEYVYRLQRRKLSFKKSADWPLRGSGSRAWIKGLREILKVEGKNPWLCDCCASRKKQWVLFSFDRFAKWFFTWSGKCASASFWWRSVLFPSKTGNDMSVPASRRVGCLLLLLLLF